MPDIIPGQELFDRDVLITIGGKPIAMKSEDLTGKPQPMLRVVFFVEKSTESNSNTAVLDVYNLSLLNRMTVQTGADLISKILASRKAAARAGAPVLPSFDYPLVIEAGYTGDRKVIFTGDITTMSSRREGVDWITTFEAGDGEKASKSSRVSFSVGAGSSVGILLEQAIAKLGINIGNAAPKLALLKSRILKKGAAINGRVRDVLDKYLPAAGYQWSVQDGELQILEIGETLIDKIVFLNQASGLIGVPELGEKGAISARSLMTGDIHPGRRVVVESSTATGTFKAEKVLHSGDTWGNDWYTDFEAKPVTI
jgi:hypothetical protein